MPKRRQRRHEYALSCRNCLHSWTARDTHPNALRIHVSFPIHRTANLLFDTTKQMPRSRLHSVRPRRRIVRRRMFEANLSTVRDWASLSASFRIYCRLALNWACDTYDSLSFCLLFFLSLSPSPLPTTEIRIKGHRTGDGGHKIVR